MPAPAVPRIRVQYNQSIYGQLATCNLWMQSGIASVPTAGQCTALATAIGNDFDTNMGVNWSVFNDASTYFENVTVFAYGAGSNAVTNNGAGTLIHRVGTAPSSSAASQALVASLYTATITRSGRGRMYFTATGNVGGGLAGIGFNATNLQNFVTKFAAHLQAIPGLAAAAPFISLVPVVQSQRTATVHPVTLVLGDTRQDRQEIREKHQTYSRYSSPV